MSLDMTVWTLLKRAMFLTDNRDLCTDIDVIDQIIIVAVSMRAPKTLDDFAERHRSGPSHFRIATCGTTTTSEVDGGKLFKQSVLSTADDEIRFRVLIFCLGVIVAVSVSALGFENEFRSRFGARMPAFQSNTSSETP